MKATTDNAVGCVCTPLKQHNQQSFFAAGYSLGWSLHGTTKIFLLYRAIKAFSRYRYTPCSIFGTFERLILLFLINKEHVPMELYKCTHQEPHQQILHLFNHLFLHHLWLMVLTHLYYQVVRCSQP